MKKIFFYSLFILTIIAEASFAQEKYIYSADLVNVKNDQVAIELTTPAINEDVAIFSFPKAIPGSYANKDFGRFISSFSAWNNKGQKLKVKKINENQYQIKNADNLYKISYLVDDTWDEKYSNFVFQPGGTNIDAGNNFVLNNHAFFGYFEGYKMLPIELHIVKPAEMFGATNLKVQRDIGHDVIQAPNYIYLADNPIIYAKADTTSFTVGNARINISVYSATGKVSSIQIAEYLKPMSVALQNFFNGLPVNSYQFLFYFEKPENAIAAKGMGGFGALEHNYSSLYFLPEMQSESKLKSLVLEVSSHEFLHILTPLQLHSKEIGDFDFINPKMSKHLWLYEGVTEYFAHLVQLQNGIIDEDQFLKNMQDKIKRSKDLWDFSMTEMSKNVLTEKYKSKYDCVYSRGALLAWMLDIFIRDKTKNEKTLKSVIQELVKIYGPNQPFADDAFFEEFISASHPDVRSFISKYIEGYDTLPFTSLLQKIGYDYIDSKIAKTYFLGNRMGLKYDEKLNLFLFIGSSENVMDIRNNDAIISINHTKITIDNIDEIWDKYFENNTSIPELFMMVLRNGREVELQGRLFSGSKKIQDRIEKPGNLTPEQQKNQQAFLMN